eukprot:1141936-Pelagomonas_calceolata.AAC.3
MAFSLVILTKGRKYDYIHCPTILRHRSLDHAGEEKKEGTDKKCGMHEGGSVLNAKFYLTYTKHMRPKLSYKRATRQSLQELYRYMVRKLASIASRPNHAAIQAAAGV